MCALWKTIKVHVDGGKILVVFKIFQGRQRREGGKKLATRRHTHVKEYVLPPFPPNSLGVHHLICFIFIVQISSS